MQDIYFDSGSLDTMASTSSDISSSIEKISKDDIDKLVGEINKALEGTPAAERIVTALESIRTCAKAMAAHVKTTGENIATVSTNYKNVSEL